jgi:hypothetical protein
VGRQAAETAVQTGFAAFASSFPEASRCADREDARLLRTLSDIILLQGIRLIIMIRKIFIPPALGPFEIIMFVLSAKPAIGRADAGAGRGRNIPSGI